MKQESLKLYILVISGVLIFTAPLVFINELILFSDLPKTAWIQILVTFMVVLTLVQAIGTRKLVVSGSIFNFLALLFLAWSAFSLIWSQSAFEGTALWIHWLVCLLFYYVIFNQQPGLLWIRRFLFIVAATTFLFSFIGCLQHLFGFPALGMVKKVPSTFGNPNFAVHVLAMAIPVIAACLFLYKEKEMVCFLGICGSVSLTYLFYTRSQAGQIALFLTGFILAVQMLYDRKRPDSMVRFDRFKIIVTTGAFILFLILVNLPQASHVRYDKARNLEAIAQIYKDPGKAASGRLKSWSNSLVLIREHLLLGVGLNNYGIFYPAYCHAVKPTCRPPGKDLTHAHNEYIQIAAELGIPGLILFLSLIFAMLWQPFRLIRKAPDAQTRVISMGILAGVVGLGVESFFSFPLRLQVPLLFLALYMAIVGTLDCQNDSAKKSVSVKKIAAKSLAGIFLVLLAAVFLANISRIKSDYHYYKANQFVMSQQWEPAMKQSRLSQKYDLFHFDNRMLLGRVYLEARQIDKALAQFSRLNEQYPYHLNTMINFGISLMADGQIKTALDLFHKAETINPSYPETETQIANIYVMQKEWDSAYQHFQKAKEKGSSNALVYYNLGLLDQKNGNRSLAIEHYEKSLKLKSDFYQLHGELGLLYYQNNGVSPKAAFHMERYLKVDQHSKLARKFKQLLAAFQAKADKR